MQSFNGPKYSGGGTEGAADVARGETSDFIGERKPLHKTTSLALSPIRDVRKWTTLGFLITLPIGSPGSKEV